MGRFAVSRANFALDFLQLHDGGLLDVLEGSLGRHEISLSVVAKSGKLRVIHDDLGSLHGERGKA